MHQVKRYNYAAQFDETIDELLAKFRNILLRGDYVPSPESYKFEEEFARFVGVANARTVGCGTDALIAALRALDIGAGDEVITQANTFYATVAAIVTTGATPVLVDADNETYLIDTDAVEDAITPRTRAIIPVHLYGKPTPMDPLLALGRRRGIAIIEDAAQAHGAEIRGRAVGSFGIAGCFSFHPSKNLAAASNGGCVVTNSDDVARFVEAYRTHGQLVQHEHILLGLNTKLDAFQALILSAKLPKLREWNSRRRDVARRYREGLADLPVSFQREDAGETHVYHLFQMRTKQRDELMRRLNADGVEATVRYPFPIHLQPPFARFGWRTGSFPVAEALGRELLALPIRPDMSEDDVDYVIERVRAFHGAAVV